MAVATDAAVPSHFDVDATFRSFVSKIGAILDSVGITKTTDTGQIDPATVAKPGAINTVQGYEIRKFTDSSQASKPIFVKIEYGSAGVVTRPAIWTTVGTGSNGSGTLTGVVGNRRQNFNTVTDALGSVVQGRAAHGEGYFSLLVGEMGVATRTTVCFILERPRAYDGVIDSGWMAMATSSNGTPSIQCGSTSVGGHEQIITNALPEAVKDQDAAGGDTVLFPYPWAVGGKPRFMMMLTYRSGRLVSGTPITVNWLGEDRDMLPLGSCSGWSSGADNLLPLIPWE